MKKLGRLYEVTKRESADTRERRKAQETDVSIGRNSICREGKCTEKSESEPIGEYCNIGQEPKYKEIA